MDKRDLALQSICPVVPMPKFSPLAPMTHNGERIILAANGTFMEVRRAWGRFVRSAGNIDTVLPFGVLQEETSYFMPKLPRELLAQFIRWAREESHVEIGASIVWDDATNVFRLVRSRTLLGTGSFLKYELPELASNQHIVVDCHSHSRHPAFFSTTDDEDDAHAVRFAFVVGNCDQPSQTTKMRLCIRGFFQDVELDLEP